MYQAGVGVKLCAAGQAACDGGRDGAVERLAQGVVAGASHEFALLVRYLGQVAVQVVVQKAPVQRTGARKTT